MGTAGPKEVLYIPAAMMKLEVATNNAPVFGWKWSAVFTTAAAAKSQLIDFDPAHEEFFAARKDQQGHGSNDRSLEESNGWLTLAVSF